MLDVARAVVLLVAIACAVRHRFATGIVFGMAMVLGFALVGAGAYIALARGAVSGEYGFAFV